MNKKILSIIFSLFLVGIFSISCSNADKTGSGNNTDNTGNGTTSKGIEQFNGNTYVSTETYDASSMIPNLTTAYLWVSVQNGQVAIYPSIDNTTEPSYLGYFNVTGSGTDYSFTASDGQGDNSGIQGTLKFSSDGSSVTVNFTKNTVMPSIEGRDIVCNKK